VDQTESLYFGKLATATYQFNEGDHKMFLEHLGSHLSTPDYDYTALVEYADDPNFYISINNTSRLLQKYIGQNTGIDISVNQSATLHVRRKGVGSVCLWTNCNSCNKDEGCLWDQDSRICHPFIASSFYKDEPKDCACEKCR